MLAIAAPPASAATLAEAVAAGLARNPDVAAAQSDRDAAQDEVRAARSGYLPSVSVSGGPQDLAPDKWSYEVTAAQTLYDWGQARSRVAGARAAERGLSQDLLFARDRAVLDITETYLDVLLARRQREVDMAQVASLEDLARMTALRAQGGYSDRAEADRARLELTRARQRLASDEGVLADAIGQYETLVGRPPDVLALPAPPSLLHDPALQDPAATIDNAPQYRKAQEDTDYAVAQYDDARASARPHLDLEATALSREIGGRMQSDSIVALRLRLDPMQGLGTFRRIDGARERIRAAQFREGAVRREIERRLRNLVTNGKALEQQEQALGAQVDGAGELSGVYREQFEVGRRDIIDLVTIEREHFDARRSLNEVQIQLIRVQYQIAAQIGSITDLVLESERQPLEHE